MDRVEPVKWAHLAPLSRQVETLRLSTGLTKRGKMSSKQNDKRHYLINKEIEYH